MKVQKYTVIFSQIITMISVISALLFLNCVESRFSNFYLDLSLGVFGGGFLTSLIGYISYFVVKKNTLEDFYSELIALLHKYRNLKWLHFEEPEKMISNYYHEAQTNALHENMNNQINKRCRNKIVRPMELSNVQKKLLMKQISIENQDLLSKIGRKKSEKILENELKKKIQKYDKLIKETMRQYITLSKVSTKGVENAWSKIDFLTGNQYRKKLYHDLLVEFFTKQDRVREAAFHFQMHLDEETTNKAAMIEFIIELQKVFFTIVNEDGDERNSIVIYNSFVNSMDRRIEEFRSKIYKCQPNITDEKPVLFIIRSKAHNELSDGKKSTRKSMKKRKNEK